MIRVQTDWPILFSATMIRALIREVEQPGTGKTQTRRIFRLPKKSHGLPIYENPKLGGWEAATLGGGGVFSIGPDGNRVSEPERVAIWHKTCGLCLAAPFQVGDRLWVGETWGDPQADIHMPRWASRLTLTVTDVRVQRLQDISEADCMAEGIEKYVSPLNNKHISFEVQLSTQRAISNVPKGAYRLLWESLHGPGSWALNPWVCAVSFSVERRNIDAKVAA